ncbi:hypothetical protein ABID21_004730 [Pseudorhizobium tarimense]|uniref:Uncharacterized protein n=1 Tax=Pseudorhizobium tarimense TaxID=1079109 RepID=A0ABV2HDS7_9HYPH|nr:hypothetical protein [Pseudorhizobium tarimense]MCJ8521619.1 hypothetical protein [Pseudorhizobium tarimense]
MDLRNGVKIYDNDWFLRHGMSPEQTADLLAEWEVTYVIAQSKFLPMPNSAVASAVSHDDRSAYEALDDVAFRERLAERNISYVACLNICFDPAFADRHPHLLGIDQHGQPGVQQDWYVGLPPDREENLVHKIGLLKHAVEALQPDAIHLGFIRWPGFWETWLDGDARASKPEYCFSAATVDRFNRETGLAVRTASPVEAAQTITVEHRDEWTTWKCQQVVNAIARIREALAPLKSGLEYSINTLPFYRTDFANAVEEVFGQNVEMLAEVVDVFEVMAYHQIMAKPETWPAAVASDIIARSGQRAVCTLQARALYLKGMHAGRGRSIDIPEQEFATALAALETSPVEGVCVFTFTDLLDMRDTPRGKAMVAALSSFRR